MTTTINNEHKKLNVPNKREQNQTCLDSAEREGLRPKGNVPNLRFPEFQGEWKEHKLEDITAEIGDGIHATPIYDDNGTFYFVNGNNISEYGIIITATTQKVTEEEALRNNASALNSYSILLSINGTVGNVALYKNESIMLGKSACYINVSSNINRNYIFYYLMMPKCQFYFTSELTGTTIKNLSLKSIRKTKVLLPNANEQSKIARLFDAINERIATQNKIIDKLQSLIKGIVDCTILRKEKNAIVGDVCSISEQIKAEANIDDIITVRLHGNGVCKSSAENLQLGATQYYRRRAGQLIYGKQNFHNGAIGIVPISLDNGITSKDIPSFDIDEMKCNSVYLLAQLQSPQYYKPAEALTTGTGSKRLKEETFLKMPIVLPNKREQDNIAVLIHRASMNLDHAKRLLELLSIQKQFLLRQMFI